MHGANLNTISEVSNWKYGYTFQAYVEFFKPILLLCVAQRHVLYLWVVYWTMFDYMDLLTFV